MATSFSARKIATHGSMIFVQLITATYIVTSKVILIQGISSTVFLVYQFMLATIVMGALALIVERNNRPPLKIPILCWIFLLALVGITLTQNLLAACLYYISSTIEAAVLNMTPVFTYIISIISREEKLEINTLWGKGKVFGTLVTVSGAMTLILWHGSAVVLLTSSLGEWVLGLAMVVAGVLAFSTWIIMLRPISMRYPAELSMNALMFFFATLQTTVVAVITSHKASKWSLKWDLELLNIVFGAVFNCGLAYLLCTWCATLKGPTFVSSFAPLGLVFTTIFETAFLGHTLHVGSYGFCSIVGSIIVVVGLYIYIWSKANEEDCHSTDGDDTMTTSLI